MAVTISATQLRTALALGSDVSDAIVMSLRKIAIALVELEGALSAPTEVANESVILTAGHLKDRLPGRLQSLDFPSVKLQFRSVGSAVRLSGARTLLSPWHERDLPTEPEDED